jgi:putative spermidine/putrescine transport system substrate-binding protein
MSTLNPSRAAKILRHFVLITSLAWVAVGLPDDVRASERFDGVTIHMQSFGGTYDDLVRRYITDPFEKETGAKVIFENGYTSASIAKLRAQKADPQVDVVMFDDIGVITSSREGLLDPISSDKVPNLRDIPSQFVFEKDKGAGFFVYINSIAYSTKDFKKPPTSWRVLWDPKYKDRVILPALDTSSIYKVLIVASIMNGGSQSNMDPGFKAMEQLKPNIQALQKSESLTAESLRSGNASLAAWQISLMKDYIAKGYPIGVTAQLKEGVFGSPACISIVKGHKAPIEALNDLVNRALSPEAQLGIAKDFWLSPTNRKVKIPDEIKQVVIPAEGSPIKLIPVDLDAFYANRSSLIERLSKVLLQ